ncbi:MAG: flagellar regulator YcgR PilZN domain-containing protein [Methylococcaceae bacterium]|jgi:c-di-GMP-binding flagellar brake protein YcgR
MLDTIRKFFFFSKNLNEIATDENGSEELDFPQNPNFVTQEGKIANLIRQLVKTPHRCSTTLEDADEIFVTTIIDLQHNPELIIFEALNSAQGNNLILKNRRVKLTTYLNNIPLTFELNDIAVGKAHDNVIFKAPLPQKMYYPQRRHSPRIAVPGANIGFSGTCYDSGLTIGGFVADLSREGLAITFIDDRHILHRGDRLENCQIELPDGRINFAISVRFLKRQYPSKNKKQFGGIFENLDGQNQKKLERYICTLEREQIRNQRNSGFAYPSL